MNADYLSDKRNAIIDRYENKANPEFDDDEPRARARMDRELDEMYRNWVAAGHPRESR